MQAATQPSSALQPRRLPPVPWRDPQTVSPADLVEYIRVLERTCAQNPQSADLRTCLGMAYAMNYDVYKSMDALETAVSIDAGSFYAQLKYAELFYRLRALPRAEEETLKALDLARTHGERWLARNQLLEIRRLLREGALRPSWTRPLQSPALLFLLLLFTLCLAVAWK